MTLDKQNGLSQSNLVLFERRRDELWKGWNAEKDQKTEVITRPESKGIRGIISEKWDIRNTDHANSHWAILEFTNRHLDIATVVPTLGVLGITRENCPLFDEYCTCLEYIAASGSKSITRQIGSTTGGMDGILSA